MQYARRRADLREWLAPLVNKRLLCHGCDVCHAHDLADLIKEEFKEKIHNLTPCELPLQMFPYVVLVILVSVSSLLAPTQLILSITVMV